MPNEGRSRSRPQQIDKYCAQEYERGSLHDLNSAPSSPLDARSILFCSGTSGRLGFLIVTQLICIVPLLIVDRLMKPEILYDILIPVDRVTSGGTIERNEIVADFESFWNFIHVLRARFAINEWGDVIYTHATVKSRSFKHTIARVAIVGRLSPPPKMPTHACIIRRRRATNIFLLHALYSFVSSASPRRSVRDPCLSSPVGAVNLSIPQETDSDQDDYINDVMPPVLVGFFCLNDFIYSQ
jgi:hypothetical protein